MGLRDDLQADLDEAFDDDLDDAVTTFTGSRTVVSGEFDPIDGMLVVNVGQDPAKATWTLQLRRP
ncbi:hypothetical protein NFI08_16270 [Halomonas sp. EF61]|uniref:hypothetical protein n=1 Tax=Halomonas sp. EF61 TaxID=2950869 RepID=UPI0032DFA6EA